MADENDIPTKSKSPFLAKLGRFSYQLDAPIFASRWLLYVIHIGLTVCLGIYVWKFALDVFNFLIESPHLEGEQLMVRVLSCIDAAMVANLIVMINIGGYQIFIHRLKIEPSVRPQWLDHLDSMMMKVKVGVSIASITGVQVLRDFMNLEHTDLKLIIERGALHILCLFSAFMFAYIWKITREDNSHAAPAPSSHGAANDTAPPASAHSEAHDSAAPASAHHEPIAAADAPAEAGAHDEHAAGAHSH